MARTTNEQNRKNVKTGQQGTNEPWKGHGNDEQIGPSPDDVVEQELRNKPSPGGKRDGSPKKLR